MPKERCSTKEYDVVVLGGGVSGICAAIASARNGAKTALVHDRPMPGGNAGSEIRMHIVGAGCTQKKEDVNESGIIMEILLENKYRNPRQNYYLWDTVLWEKCRFQENLELFLNTSMHSVEFKNDNIEKVVCYQLTTEITYHLSAKIFIDATGHGTLGFFANAKYRIGSESREAFDEPGAPEIENSYTMGNTIEYQAVDRGYPVEFKKPFWAYSYSEEDLKYRAHYEPTQAEGETEENQKHQRDKSHDEAFTNRYFPDAGFWWVELGGDSDDIIADAENIRDEVLKSIYGVWDHIKNVNDHGMANYDLGWIGKIPGTRESRRLEGDYLLNENDILENRIFEDAVAYGGWPIDEHNPRGLLDLENQPYRVTSFDGVYTIPYRCYYSKNIKNLMMAGRDISATKRGMSSARVQGTCAVGGQASGTAAALAVKYGCLPRELSKNIKELQQTLIKDDCFIPGFKNEDENDMAVSATITATSFLKGMEPEKVVSGVARKVGNESNCWESDGISDRGESLVLSFEGVKRISQIRLTFDPNLSRDFMPSIHYNIVNRQYPGTPPELVRDYELNVYCKENKVWHTRVEDNYQRLNVLDLPKDISGDRIELTVSATNGYPNVKVFEMRVY